MALLRISRKRCAAWICALTLLLSIGWQSRAQTPAPRSEYEVKAVFLFNFTQFVEWPDSAFPTAQAPLVIGVLGDDPFGSDLDKAVSGEKIKDHPLVVRRFKRIEDAEPCHILFIGASETEHLSGILGRLKGREILTVGDSDQFTREGGIVRFVTENNRIRLRINIEAAKAAHLTISSKLLSLATIVTPDNK
jgi:hypothetical protein